LQYRVVGQGDGDLLSGGDDVVVGDDQARSVDDEARAERGDASAVRRTRRALIAEEIAEEFVEGRSRRILRRVLRRLGERGRRPVGGKNSPQFSCSRGCGQYSISSRKGCGDGFPSPPRIWRWPFRHARYEMALRIARRNRNGAATARI